MRIEAARQPFDTQAEMKEAITLGELQYVISISLKSRSQMKSAIEVADPDKISTEMIINLD